MRLRRQQLVVAIAALCSGAVWGPAAAQETVAQEAAAQDAPAPAAVAGENEPVELDRLIVTAQSREQELQDVPIALQVVDAEMIDDLAAFDLGDIDTFVPGLEVGSSQPTQANFAIRGINTDDFGIGTDGAVGVYIDGVYTGRGSTLLPFIDMQRVEVLKGPQGTLFGRNTAAGAISIVTNRPGNETEARANLRLGNYHKQYVTALVNTPVGENSAFRISGLFNHSDGWIQDGATGEDLSPENTWASRASWRTNFGESTSATLTWDHENLDQRTQATTGIVVLPPAPGVPSVPVDESAYLDPRKTPTYTDAVGNEESRRFDGLTLLVEHGFDWGDLTATTAWRDYDSQNANVDSDGTNRANLYIADSNFESGRNFYQEIKFNGRTERLDWVAGASYFRDETRQSSEVNLLTDSVDTAMVNIGAVPPEFGIPAGLGVFGYGQMLLDQFGVPLRLLGQPWNEAFYNRLDAKAYALFGDVIWHATDKLNLTFGLRYTRDEKDFSWFNPDRSAPELDAALDQLEAMGLLQALGIPREALLFNLAFVDPPAVLNRNQVVRTGDSWSDFSPRFVADYHFNDNAMVYASLAKGYKAGGFNALQIGSHYDNEEVWNFETGIKQYFPEQRLQYNASAYYYVYDNRQSNRLDTSTDVPRYVVDSSDLEAWGVDFDAAWQATDALRLDFNAAFIDSTYKDYVTPTGVDLSGQTTGQPYWSYAAGLEYRWRLAEAGDLRLALRHSYRGKTRCNNDSDTQGECGVSEALDLGEARNRTDARLAWTSPRGFWTWSVYGNNLFDNQYVIGLATYGREVLGTVGGRYTAPRTYGVEVAFRY